MKNRLSQLVGLRNDVSQCLTSDVSINDNIFQSLEEWKTVWRNYDSDLYKDINEISLLEDQILDIEKKFNQIKQENQKLIIDKLQNEIDQLVSNIVNCQKYKENFSKVLPEKSMISYDPACYKKIKNKIFEKVDWRYPGLELGSLHKDLTRAMIASDPLYLFDHVTSFTSDNIGYHYSTRLDNNVKQFNEIYQKRIRIYTELDKLPKSQFGFVFSWEFFNYLTSDITKNYLTQIYNLLRDGGSIMFGYNNCDIECGAKSAELFAQSWNTSTDLIAAMKNIGYINIKEYIIDNDDIITPQLCWIEATKPGELKTIKAHQVLPTVRRR